MDQLHRLNINDENRLDDVAREDQRTGVAESSAAKAVQESDRDVQTIETNGPDSPTMRLNDSVDRMHNVQSEEKQQKKRKRNIMNNVQIALIENALRDEPEMQRKAALIQFWADKLSLHVCKKCIILNKLEFFYSFTFSGRYDSFLRSFEIFFCRVQKLLLLS